MAFAAAFMRGVPPVTSLRALSRSIHRPTFMGRRGAARDYGTYAVLTQARCSMSIAHACMPQKRAPGLKLLQRTSSRCTCSRPLAAAACSAVHPSPSAALTCPKMMQLPHVPRSTIGRLTHRMLGSIETFKHRQHLRRFTCCCSFVQLAPRSGFLGVFSS